MTRDIKEQFAPRYPWHSSESDYIPVACRHCREPIYQVIDTWIHCGDNVFCRPQLLKQAELLGANMNLPDIEVVSAKVHEAWMKSKQAQGVTTRQSEQGEELMVPYEHLSDAAKELDRGTVRAVYAAIEATEQS